MGMVRHRRVQGGAVWKRALIGLILLGVLAALRVALSRSAQEAGYRTVEVIVDGDSVVQVAQWAGVNGDELFATLRDLGVTSVAVTERRVEDALAAGQIALVRPGELVAVTEDAPTWLSLPVSRLRPDTIPEELPAYLVWQQGALGTGTEEALARRLRSVGGFALAADPVVWEIPARTLHTPQHLYNPAEGAKSIGLGFDEDVIARIADLGLSVALRPLDSPGFSSDDVAARLAVLAHLPTGHSLIIFDGSAVPGAPATLNTWADSLGAASVPVAWIEFAAQRGLDRVVRSSEGGAVRLHSIGGPELHGLHPDDAVARWLRAAVERSVRALYVRFYTEPPAGYPPLSPEQLLDLNLAYVGELTTQLERRRFTLGPAAPLQLPEVRPAALVLLLLSVAAASVCLLRLFVRLPVAVEVLLLILLSVLFLLPDGYTGRRLAAFAAAVGFPTLATVWTLQQVKRTARDKAPLRSLAALGVATAISLAGALHVVGLLSETPFAIGVDLFWGVKAMHVLPPILIAAALLWERPVGSLRDMIAQGVALLRRPLPFGYVLAFGALAALALVIVLRTGTDILPVPGLEQWLRTTLEKTLGVRPRNKEFLLGHPAFVITAFLIIRRRPSSFVTATGAALAGIGQLSLINTFAHIHSPLVTSFVRTVYGVVLGGVLGLVAAGVLTALLRLWTRGEG